MNRLSLAVSMRRAIIAAMVVALPVIVTGCAPTPNCTGTGSVAHRDLRYKDSPDTSANLQSLDLYLPERASGCSPVPLVVYVHGGGFVIGGKANKITQKVDLFTGEGWALASLNYRLVGDPGAGPSNCVYPAAEQDIASAVAYLQSRADQYGLDVQSTMLLGHSAGAFLVALTSTDGSFLEGAGLDLADIACAAPLDTTYDISAQIARGGTEEAMFRNAFGDDAAVWRRASPPNDVTPGKALPAFHIVTRGAPHRIEQSQAFGSSLRNAGIEADVQVVTGLSHEEVNAAVGQAGETRVTGPLMEFYRGCVAGDQEAG